MTTFSSGSRGARCAKCTLVFFNLFFWVTGLAFIAAAIWMSIDKESFIMRARMIEAQMSDSSPTKIPFQYVSYVFYGVGSIVFLFGFLGCCGAVRESKCMLGTYIFLLVIIFILEAGIGASLFFYRDRVKVTSEDFIRKQLQADTEDSKEMFNTFQEQFECCGSTGPSDYRFLSMKMKKMAVPTTNTATTTTTVMITTSTVAPADAGEDTGDGTGDGTDTEGGTGGRRRRKREVMKEPKDVGYMYVPESCCPMKSNNTQCQAAAMRIQTNTTAPGVKEDDSIIYKKGCVTFLFKWFDDRAYIIIAVCLAFAAIQIIGIAVACLLCCSIGKETTDLYEN